MTGFTYRTWVALGICGVTIGTLWLFVSLFQGFLLLFAGLLLSIFLKGLAARLQKLAPLKYETAFPLVVLALLGLAGAVFYLMGNQISASVSEFIEQLDQAQAGFWQRMEEKRWWKPVIKSAQDYQQALMPSNAFSTATSAISSIMTTLGGSALVLFLGFYFAFQADLYRHGLLLLIPERHQSRAKELIDKMEATLWDWLLGRLVGMTVIGVCSALGLWAIGIPMPITLGVLAGLLTFIPNIGPLIALIPPLLFGLRQGGNTAIYVLMFYLILQFAESYFLTPLITQKQVGLPPGLTLACQLLFGMLAGFLGLLLATPLTALLHVLIMELYVKQYLGKEPMAAED